ncbi:MAG: hypothetical protein KC609_21030 [Myxococcales bacterium]|nr:hypothetical protein [Myxococcales bacterium]
MTLVDGKNCVTPCPPGTTGSDGNCVNINECAGTPCNDEGDHDDNSGQDGQGCTEIPLNSWQAPGYTCSCQAGYFQGIGSGGYRTCVIGDECSSGANNCSPTARCNDPNPAPSSLGDYTCTCPSGYEGDGRSTGTGCTDIDECKKTPGICDNGPLVGGVCKNRPGGYDCVCPEGQLQFGSECLAPCP